MAAFTIIHGGRYGTPVTQTPKAEPKDKSLWDYLPDPGKDRQPTPEPPQRPFTLVKTAAR